MEQVLAGLELYYQRRYRGSECAVQDVKLIGSGMESQIYSVILQLDRDCQSLVLRLFRSSPISSASDRARREYQGLCWLEQQGYPVPRVYDFITDERYLGSSFITMEQIDGVPLWSYLNKASEEERTELVKQGIELFVRLHTLPFEQYPVRPDDNVIAAELNMVSNLLKEFQKHGFARAVEHLVQRGHGIKPQPAVTHGDFHFDNILLQPDGSMRVIDWTMVGVNDYRVDVGWSLALMGTDRRLRDAVVELYQQVAGRSIPELDFFEAYGVLRRLGLFAIILQDGPQAIGLKAGADDRIRQYMGAHVRGLYQTWVDLTGLQLPEIKPYFGGLLD